MRRAGTSRKHIRAQGARSRQEQLPPAARSSTYAGEAGRLRGRALGARRARAARISATPHATSRRPKARNARSQPSGAPMSSRTWWIPRSWWSTRPSATLKTPQPASSSRVLPVKDGGSSTAAEASKPAICSDIWARGVSSRPGPTTWLSDRRVATALDPGVIAVARQAGIGLRGTPVRFRGLARGVSRSVHAALSAYRR
jgi:hypothetical protein